MTVHKIPFLLFATGAALCFAQTALCADEPIPPASLAHPVAGDKLTDTQKQRLGGRFNNEFAKYQEESARAAQAGAAPIGFHNWLTGKGPAGLKADWEKMTPADRGETPWMFNERQRVQYR